MTRRRPTLIIASLLATALCAAPAHAAPQIVPHEVVVKRAGQAPTVKTVRNVHKALDALRRSDSVQYAAPNPVAHAAAFVPNDPGRGRGWQALQWNFLQAAGVNAPVAWQHAIDAGAPGGRGVTIAVLDSGAAYADRGRYRQSPDLAQTRFLQGYDFIDGDAYPNDDNGHGTHVTSTIAESTNNGIGLTGLAYGASIMPVRVLDARGEGDAATIAEAVRFAVRRGADLINLSLEFGTDVGAKEIPTLLDALAFARKRGVLVVGASGNEGDTILAFPARSSNVFSVGATTEHGCLSDYSNLGRGLDIVAPGGGTDALDDDPNCRPEDMPGRPILQITFEGDSVRRFGLPSSYEGTSMAVPHVTATAALVLASRVLGPNPSPEDLIAHLKATARDLGPKGVDTHYGAGLVDAAAATDRRSLAALQARARR
ncbi:MAG TPA: S8 family serine peptidase [Solirubrobacteraceae bacterium]|jgi:serine protease